MSAPRRTVLPDAAALAERAAELVLEAARAALAARGRFDLVLSGGSTPAHLYRALARRPAEAFGGWHLWWGDERLVPPDDQDSNQRLVRETLLASHPWPPERVHPIPTEGVTAAEAARLYERALRAELGVREPLFDLVLLGLGTDGHTASLFPGGEALDVRDALAAAARPAHAPHARVTLSLPALCSARDVLFLVSGAEKRAMLARVLALAEPAPELPASLVRARAGRTLWLCDEAAAG